MKTLLTTLKRLGSGILFAAIPLIGGCGDNTMTWQEEVKLLDGRTITVIQKRRYEEVYTGQDFGRAVREAWLTIKLPEFDNREIVWNEKLDPMVVNIYAGKLYVIGMFPTGREFDIYGGPQPPYVGFRWNGTTWQRIPFVEIPEAIYDGNMVIDLPADGTTMLTIEKKNSLNGNLGYSKEVKRIDPSYKSNFQ